MGPLETPQDCNHDWASTGLWEDSDICVPCKHCEAELRQHQDGTYTVNHTGFSTTINGIKLDLEDDPDGGVVKVVCREINRDYDLDIPFEKGDVVIDIGAHVGIVSIYLAKMYPFIKIYAFEPMPDNYLRLIRNIKKNNVKNIITTPCAITSDGRDVTLYGDIHSNSGGISANVNSTEEYVKVHSMTLPDMFEEFKIDKVRLLKIDCEGSEYEILTKDGWRLSCVDYVRGEFHMNKQLAAKGYTLAGLVALCKKRMLHPENFKITQCVMGD